MPQFNDSNLLPFSGWPCKFQIYVLLYGHSVIYTLNMFCILIAHIFTHFISLLTRKIVSLNGLRSFFHNSLFSWTHQGVKTNHLIHSAPSHVYRNLDYPSETLLLMFRFLDLVTWFFWFEFWKELINLKSNAFIFLQFTC